MACPAQDRAGRCAAYEQRAGDEQRTADDRGTRVADQTGKSPAERKADPAAAVLPEQRHETEKADADSEPERAHIEEIAAREHEPADREERQRQDVGAAPMTWVKASASHEPTAPPSNPR